MLASYIRSNELCSVLAIAEHSEQQQATEEDLDQTFTIILEFSTKLYSIALITWICIIRSSEDFTQLPQP